MSFPPANRSFRKSQLTGHEVKSFIDLRLMLIAVVRKSGRLLHSRAEWQARVRFFVSFGISKDVDCLDFN